MMPALKYSVFQELTPAILENDLFADINQFPVNDE